ncbi:MAG: hypothetical protein GXZ08_05560 [Tissierellia bacterium]|nr:hypothetical protein [Tissierellia bacterium]
MSNIDNIKNKIEENSNERVEEILNESKEICDKILLDKENEAKIASEAIVSKANRDAELLIEKIVSRASLSNRDKLLGVKQNIVEDVFEKALIELNDLPEDKYLSFFNKTIADIDLDDTMSFVLPKQYREAVRKANPNINISEEETESGFKISKDNIVLNYNFNDLVDYMRADLEAEIASILFKEE